MHITQLLNKPKGKVSRRSLLLQDLADATGIDFQILLRNTFHLTGEWGIEILNGILEDTLMHSNDPKYRRVKASQLIKASHGK
jgi:hypothetical protein